jgi:SMI1-KNR4 cell-wall
MNEIIALLLKNRERLVGCSLNEILKLESYFKIRLPQSYLMFLHTFGRSAGKFMLGTDAFYKDLFKLRTDANELLVENDQPELPHDSFVFWMHQGYQFAFFLLDGNQDPPVYFYLEGEILDMQYPYKATLTDFFVEQLTVSGIKDA